MNQKGVETELDMSFSISSQSDVSSLNVYMAEDGGDKTPNVSFDNSSDSIEVRQDEILRIFHKDDIIPDEINEISGGFCEKLLQKILSDNNLNQKKSFTNDHEYSTKFNTHSTKKNNSNNNAITNKKSSAQFSSSNESKTNLKEKDTIKKKTLNF